MVWAGNPFAQRIEFSTGLPAGAVSYALYGNDGTTLVQQDVTPAEGAVSYLLLIGGEHNTCALPLFESRRLTWHYVANNDLVTGEATYRVDRLLPFAATANGVREKLGVEPHELRDEEIDLVTAYANFDALFDAGTTATVQGTGTRAELLAIHAVEAVAALAILPTLQVKIAQRETSGTDEYQRFTKMDWSLIEVELFAHIERARTTIDPVYEQNTSGSVTSFSVAGQTTDPFTGDSYS